MSTVTLALSVSIAVVLVLLLTCRGKKSNKSKKCNQVVDNVHTASPDNVSTGRSVINANATKRYNDLVQNVAGYEDYNAMTQYMALEPEVFESQDRYTADMNRFNMGPSELSERSDANDIVPWMGLRRPDYQSIYAGAGARTESSESPDQLPMNRPLVLG